MRFGYFFIAIFAFSLGIQAQGSLANHLYRIDHDSLDHSSYILVSNPTLSPTPKILENEVGALFARHPIYFLNDLGEKEEERLKFFMKMEKKTLQKLLSKTEFAEVDALTTELLDLDLIFFNRDFPFFHQERLETALSTEGESVPFEAWLQAHLLENEIKFKALFKAEGWSGFYENVDLKAQSQSLLAFSRDTANFKLYLEDQKNQYRAWKYGRAVTNYKAFVSPIFYNARITQVISKMAGEMQSRLTDTANIFVVDLKLFGGADGLPSQLRNLGFTVEPNNREDVEDYRKVVVDTVREDSIVDVQDSLRVDSLTLDAQEKDSLNPFDTLEIVASDSSELIIEKNIRKSYYASNFVISKRMYKIIDGKSKGLSQPIDPLKDEIPFDDSLLASLEPLVPGRDSTEPKIERTPAITIDWETAMAPVQVFSQVLLQDRFEAMASISLMQFEKRLSQFIDPYELMYKEASSPLDTIKVKNWYNYVSLDGGFSVKLPASPTLELSKPIQIAEGEMEMNIVGYNDDFNGIKYHVGYNDYPPSFQINDPDSFFTVAIKTAAEGIKCRILRISNVVNEFYEGREVIMIRENNIMIKAKYYLIGKRLYQLLMSGTEDQINSPAGRAFFGSFKLINKEQVEWKILRSKEGKFSIQFPEVPEESFKQVEIPDAGKFPIHNFLLDHPPTGLVFLLSYSDYPNDYNFGNRKLFLQGTLNGMERTLKGKTIKRNAVSKGAFEGQEALIRVRNNQFYRSQVFLKGNRMYQLVLSGPKPKVLGKEAERFLNSFKITQ